MMATQTVIEIKYQPHTSDYVRAAQRYYRTTFFFIGDKVVAILLLLFGLGSTVIIGIHWWTIIFMILAPIEWFDIVSPYKLKAYLGCKLNPKFRNQFEVTFDQHGIHFITANIDSNIDWTYYHTLLEDKNVFLLVFGRWQYSVIPKRAFANTSEQDAFRELARQMIGQSAKN